MIDFQFYIKKYAYLIGIVVFAIWMLFFDSNSWLSHRKLNKEIEVLKRQKEFLQKEIVKDRDIIREINTAEGKNLVGAFWPPAAVLCEIGTLRTLPEHELLTGMAEVVKCGFIADPQILDIIEGNPEKIRDSQSAVVRELIERAIRVKAEVVSEDLRESGRREILNYGHTLGHAVEHAERYQWRHGAAVAVGMVFAAELSLAAGYADEALVDRTRSILTSLDLPVSYRGDRWKDLLDTMRRDKKSRGAILRFIVLEGLARPRVYEVPDESILYMTYQEIAE